MLGVINGLQWAVLPKKKHLGTMVGPYLCPNDILLGHTSFKVPADTTVASKVHLLCANDD